MAAGKVQATVGCKMRCYRNPSHKALTWGRFFCVIVSTWVSSFACAQDWNELPEQLTAKVVAAQQACSDHDDGKFALEFGAVHRVDLNGDRYQDWVLDEAGFACSTHASMYCGTGGCVSHFLIGDHVNSLLNQGWEMINITRNRALLANVHGSQCEGNNPTPCVVASVWDKEKSVWRSTVVQWE